MKTCSLPRVTLITAGHVLPIARAAGGRFVDWDSKCNNFSEALGGQTVFCNISAARRSDHLLVFVNHLGNLQTSRFLPLSRTYGS